MDGANLEQRKKRGFRERKNETENLSQPGIRSRTIFLVQILAGSRSGSRSSRMRYCNGGTHLPTSPSRGEVLEVPLTHV